MRIATMSQRQSILFRIGAIAALTFAGSVYGADDNKGAVKADPALPNVLLIGDSISLGYTEPVREFLKGRANVYRAPGNCQDSATGVKNVKQWLGNKKWDVIHFNFGIWDIHPLRNGKEIVLPTDMDKNSDSIAIRHTTKQYIENLTKILAVLNSTDAKLIWASTTPVSVWKDSLANIERNNKAAAALMAEHGVAINDLHAYVSPNLRAWQTGDKCHFNKLGNAELGKRVSRNISDSLGPNKDKSHKSNPSATSRT
jgi:hypothetical protein